MRVVVVMPTYNEAGNIGRMLQALLAPQGPLARSGHAGEVLVVDDHSQIGRAHV